ncbi:Serine/threonine-protein kinase Nek10 [Elasticomyces elasticus]|nr:Serine/threonine-protein kinase Nek10 [Elasticomyces elasticus]
MGKGSDIIILFSIILVIVLIMELINLLNKHMPPRRPLRGESAPLLRSSTPAHISRSWFWPRSEQSSQRNADLETGLSQGYGTFDEVHDEDPEAPQPIPQLLHVTKRAKPFNPAPSSFYSRPVSLPSRRATSSPSQSMLLESPATSQDKEETSPPAAEYRTLHTFGESGEGQVRVVKEKVTAELFVIKTLRTRTRKDGTFKMPNEVAMLTLHLEDHLNIIQCYDYSYGGSPDNTFCHLRLEYCDGGDLFDFCAHWRKLKRQDMFVPDVFIMHFLISMADALEFLHLQHRVIHRDIKGPNIFLRWSGTLTYGMPDIVLSDLGFSCFESESRGICGSPGMYPCEVLPMLEIYKNDPVAWENMKLWQAKHMTYASDMYCLGATLYELIFLNGFDNTRMTYSPTELAQRFNRGPYTRSPWMLNILTGCLAEDPKDRLTTAELVHAAKGMKAALRAMGDAGVRMPANSWPTMQLDCDRVQAPVAGSSESFRVCWCENHGAMSLRKPKLGCETSQSMTYRPRPGARARVSEEAADAGAGADEMMDADMDMGIQAGQLVACAA